MGSAGNLELGFFPSCAGSGLGCFYEQRENLSACPPAIYLLRVEFSIRSRTRAVRVMGQFDINDSIEKI
jgi:hypothetical protein